MFKKKYGLTVSVKWLPAEKPSVTQLLASESPANGSRQSPVSLPQQTSTLYNSPGFCRAVGGPGAPQQPHGRSTATSPMMLLSNMCQAAGFGEPRYEISFHKTGPDGYLHFTYKVFVLGINMSFPGVIKISPAAAVISSMEEAWGVVAQHVLNTMLAGLHS